MLAHIGTPGPAPFIAMGLFTVGFGTAFGAYAVAHGTRSTLRRAAGVGLGVVTVGCFGVATALPFVLRPGPVFSRPSTSATLRVVSPAPGHVYRGSPATIPVDLVLVGGKIVPVSSTHLVANEGHIHLYLDNRLVAMTGLRGPITASPGHHTLRVEFVAIDHGPFHPRVVQTVTFDVQA